MSASDDRWVSAEQYRSIQVGLRIVSTWAEAVDDPEAALQQALQREIDPTEIVVGLATVARLLSSELAALSHVSESTILARLRVTVDRLQHPIVSANSR